MESGSVILTLGSMSSVEMHLFTALFTTSSSIKWTRLKKTKQTNKEYTQNHNELLANRSIYQKEEKRKFQLSSSLTGLLWDNEPIIQTEHNMVKNPNGRRRTRSLFISVSTDPLFSL